MAILVTMEGDGTLEDYQRVNATLDVENDPPAGLILHATVDLGGGRLKSVDVWDSADASRAFYEGRLGPAIAEVMGPDAGQPSPPEIREIVDLIHP